MIVNIHKQNVVYAIAVAVFFQVFCVGKLNAEPVVRKLVDGFRFTEGPAADKEGNIYFTDIPNSHIHKWSIDGTLSTFLEDSGRTNGLYFDAAGNLIGCSSGRGKLISIDPQKNVTVLAEHYQDKPFNSPNDLWIDLKGGIYFTDPRYGNRDGMEIRDPVDRMVEGVYRIDAPGEVVQVIAHEVDRPNGLLVSPNDEYLYVADNNNDNVGGARTLWRFNLNDDGSIDPATKKMIFDWQDSRGPDGLEMDQAGRLWVAGGRNEPVPPNV